MNIIGHKFEDGDLKTEESYRNIPIPKRLKNMLLNIKNEKMDIYKKQGKKWDNSDYVFLNQLGHPYTPERLPRKIQEFIKKYKLEHMTVYGFRHSFATLMSEQGMDREVLRELMGHSEFETTDFYYIHISEERKKNKNPQICLRVMVQLTGLEPATSRFVAECSIQLSYSCIYRKYYKTLLQYFQQRIYLRGNSGENFKTKSHTP